MSTTTCTTCYNRSCPESVAVTLNQTLLSLGDDDAIVDIYCETVTGTTLTLPAEPLSGYALSVYVNGLLQQVGKHYTVDGDEITFVNTLTGDDVQVVYARVAE